VYSAQSRLIAQFLAAQERLPVAVSAALARGSQPEVRIDIPRHEWLRDMRRTRRHFERIMRRNAASEGAGRDTAGLRPDYVTARA
jgi:hypothetical protein